MATEPPPNSSPAAASLAVSFCFWLNKAAAVADTAQETNAVARRATTELTEEHVCMPPCQCIPVFNEQTTAIPRAGTSRATVRKGQRPRLNASSDTSRLWACGLAVSIVKGFVGPDSCLSPRSPVDNQNKF